MKDLDLNTTDPEEQFANEFAMNLLMPEQELRSEFKKTKRKYGLSPIIIISLAIQFGLPPEIMYQRINSLDLRVPNV